MHEEERASGRARREMQAAARLEIEALREQAGDGPRHGRAQTLLDGPARRDLVLGLGEDEARRIEA